MSCNYINVHPVTSLGEVESSVHKKLRHRFPNNIVDGDSDYYVYIRENEAFLDFFGDWTNPTTHADLLTKAANTNTFNEQGEPALLEDLLGAYFLNIKGEKHYLNNLFNSLSFTEVSELINSFTGDYIQASGESIKDFIKNKLDTRIKDLSSFIIDEEKLILKEKNKNAQLKKENQLDLIRGVKDKLDFIARDNTLLNTLEKRVIARLEKNNFKYTEVVGDKEDNSTHEDIKNYILESNTTSNRAINDEDILSFLASVPKFEDFNEDVLLQKEKVNPLLLTTSYMDQSNLWGKLEALFANVIANNTNASLYSKDLFDNYITKLEDVVKYTKHPELNYVLDYFKNRANDKFKTKMVNAFFKSKQNYLITQVDNSTEGRILFRIVDPNQKTGKESKLADEYVETALNKGGINIPQIQSKARFDFNVIKNTTDKEKIKRFLSDLLITQLGMNLSPRTINFFVENNTKVEATPLIALINKFLNNKIKNTDVFGLEEPVGELDVLNLMIEQDDKDGTFKDYLLRDRSFLKELANADAVFKDEVSESTVIVAGQQRWQYSYMSGLQLEILKWQAGNIDSLLQLKDRGLQIVDFLLEDPNRIQNIKIHTNSEMKKENDPNPVLHKDISEIDLHLDIFAKMFNSKDDFIKNTTGTKEGVGAQAAKELSSLQNYLVYNFGADKNSLFSIFGLPTPNSNKPNLFNLETKTIGKDLKNVLKKYVLGELKKAQTEGAIAEGYFTAENKLKYLMDNLIPDYHYKSTKNIEVEELTSEDFKRGNFYKAGIFSDSLDKYASKKFNVIYDNTNVPIVRESFLKSKAFNNLMDVVYNDIQGIIEKNFNYLNSIILTEKATETSEVAQLLGQSDTLQRSLFDVETNITFDSRDHALYSYIISNFLNSYELSNIFNGHIAYYKQKDTISLDDFLKRAPAIAADGLYLRHRKSNSSKEYTDYHGTTHTIPDKDDKIVVAIVTNIDIAESSHANLIAKGRKTNKIKYGHEIADAQGYITDTHFRDIIERTHGWSDYDQRMFDELSNRNHNYTDENIRWIKRFSKSYTPLKMVHFEVNEAGVPIYLKYSLAPLFPAITANSDMDKLYKAMKNQGVEQVVFKSGSKASNSVPTTLHNLTEKGAFAGLKDNINLNPFQIESSKIKIQVQIPTKLDGSLTLGNQSIKNILSNLQLNKSDYTFQGKEFTGQEIYDMINSTSVSILQTQLNSVLKSLGYKDGEFSMHSVKRLLLKQLDVETESDLRYLLSTDLPLETVPNFAQRAFPVISAYLHKNAGKIYTNGSSLVQVANIGFDRLSHNESKGIFFFDKNNTTLTPPLPKTDSKGNIIKVDGKMQIEKAKILLPFSSLFAKSGLSYNAFIKLYKAGKIDKKIFKNALGYRIPNQAMSSNDSFEIIGILPPIAGDQAILYHEITAKTGSDFDIDKMYTVLPNFHVQKKFFIPEEHGFKFGKDIPHLGDMLESKQKSGNAILNLLLQDEEVKNLIAPGQKKAFFEHPINLIMDNYEEIFDILKTNNTTFREDNEDLLLVDLLADLSQAYHKQKTLIREKKKELFKKYGKVESIKGIRYIDNNKYRGKQNQLIELLASILESPSSYDDLMSPLDSNIIKETINDVRYEKALANEEISEEVTREEYLESLEISALEEMFPVNLVKARVDVLEAKSLISIMANNMTDLGESQKVGFSLTHPIGIKDEKGDALSLDRTYMIGEKGNSEQKLTKIVSYLMNAAVDAAKDNYIIEGNFNTYTANAAMLLIRLGVSPADLFTILMNDTIIHTSIMRTNATAKLSDLQLAEFNPETLANSTSTFLKVLAENDNDLFKVISREDFLTNSKPELIGGFWNLIQELGKEFNESVVITKADSNGPGKNISEHIALNNRIERVEVASLNNSFKKWFKNGLTEKNKEFNPNIQNNADAKYLGAIANNTLFLMNELSNAFFIETSSSVREAVNSMLAAIGDPLSTNTQSIKLIYNYLYSNLLHNTGHKIYNIDAQREKFLLKEFPKELQDKKDTTNNAFLNELFVNTRETENLIRFPNFKNYAPQDKLKFKEAFLQLENTDRDFTFALVQYAFLTTGFKSTHYSFNDLIPASFFIDNMHGRAIQEFIDVNHKINYAETLTTMAKNNHKNFKIVKKISRKLPITTGSLVTDPKALEKVTNKDGTFKPFITKGRSLMMLSEIHADHPLYRVIDKVDNKKFKKYSFNNVETGLITQENKYVSYINDMYKEFTVEDTTIPDNIIPNNVEIKEIQNNLLSLPKPEIEIEYLSTQELVDSDDPISNKKKQDTIKQEIEDLENLINCIWS